ncbi:hypothetical protein RPB_3475 [Rhodopseudomonas palustris HaA2]|uniref:Uncharacterized protein n=1 Tax=Rhodopseudomonas palustris (strain HaA2) TaxID=316058 RepID=Q2IUD9_RHOP2|nr:hypothetical protein RPB_3475 [Rhodopseudomonas palustris HaA2]
MSTIGLIACSKTKRTTGAPAALLYSSALFKKSLLYSLTNTDRTYILSAKHGLLDLNTYTQPYEQTLKSLDQHAKNIWADRVRLQLSEVIKQRDLVLVLAGREYHSGLLPFFARTGCRIDFPLGTRSFGNRLKYLSSANDEASLADSFRQFYKIMHELYVAQGGGRLLADCTGRQGWPDRGVYFFLENNEANAASLFPRRMPRIVRVGTHAVSSGSKTTLWDRLSTHRGALSGGGSHRSSIFRLHVGRTLLTSQPEFGNLKSWGVGQVASKEIRTTESALEAEVSKTLGTMRVLWLDIGDEPAVDSDRAFVEQSSIGLLSRFNVLTPQAPDEWLGRQSHDYRIFLSGLWNLNYTFRRPHREFLTVLRRYVDITLQRESPTHTSIAPQGWASEQKPTVSSTQLNLFANDKN